MAVALRSIAPSASRSDVAKWLELVAGDALQERARRVRAIEAGSITDVTEIDAPSASGRPSDELTGSIDLDVGLRPVAAPAPLPAEEVHASSQSATRDPAAQSSRLPRIPHIRAVALLVIVAALGVALVLVRTTFLRGAEVTTTRSPQGEPVALPASDAAAPGPSASNDDRAPHAPKEPSSAPSASASSRAPAAAGHAPSIKRVAAPRASSQRCNPPYREVVVGSNLRRIPKPECE